MITLISTHACSNCGSTLEPGSDEWDRHQRVYANNQKNAEREIARVEHMRGKQFRFEEDEYLDPNWLVTLLDFRVAPESLCSPYGPTVRAVFDKPIWGPHYQATEVPTFELHDARLGDDGIYTVDLEDF